MIIVLFFIFPDESTGHPVELAPDSFYLNSTWTLRSGEEIEWEDAVFLMGAQARIRIDQGASFEAINCSFVARDTFWQGIEVRGQADSLWSSDFPEVEELTTKVRLINCQFTGARTAFNMEAAVHFQCDSSRFINCINSLQIRNARCAVIRVKNTAFEFDQSQFRGSLSLFAASFFESVHVQFTQVQRVSFGNVAMKGVPGLGQRGLLALQSAINWENEINKYRIQNLDLGIQLIQYEGPCFYPILLKGLNFLACKQGIAAAGIGELQISDCSFHHNRVEGILAPGDLSVHKSIDRLREINAASEFAIHVRLCRRVWLEDNEMSAKYGSAKNRIGIWIAHQDTQAVRLFDNTIQGFELGILFEGFNGSRYRGTLLRCNKLENTKDVVFDLATRREGLEYSGDLDSGVAEYAIASMQGSCESLSKNDFSSLVLVVDSELDSELDSICGDKEAFKSISRIRWPLAYDFNLERDSLLGIRAISCNAYSAEPCQAFPFYRGALWQDSLRHYRRFISQLKANLDNGDTRLLLRTLANPDLEQAQQEFILSEAMPYLSDTVWLQIISEYPRYRNGFLQYLMEGTFPQEDPVRKALLEKCVDSCDVNAAWITSAFKISPYEDLDMQITELETYYAESLSDRWNILRNVLDWTSLYELAELDPFYNYSLQLLNTERAFSGWELKHDWQRLLNRVAQNYGLDQRLPWEFDSVQLGEIRAYEDSSLWAKAYVVLILDLAKGRAPWWNYEPDSTSCFFEQVWPMAKSSLFDSMLAFREEPLSQAYHDESMESCWNVLRDSELNWRLISMDGRSRKISSAPAEEILQGIIPRDLSAGLYYLLGESILIEGDATRTCRFKFSLP